MMVPQRYRRHYCPTQLSNIGASIAKLSALSNQVFHAPYANRRSAGRAKEQACISTGMTEAQTDHGMPYLVRRHGMV
jgi:hypothetical protein